MLNKEGLAGVLARLTGLLRERRPSLLVIDSFKALRAYSRDEACFRRFLHDLAGQLTAMPVTSFWVGEYDGTEATETPEFAVADAIISLGNHRIAERSSPRLPRSSSFAAAVLSRGRTPIESLRAALRSSPPCRSARHR